MPHGRDQRPMQLPGVTKLVLGLAESFCMQNEAFVQHFTYVVFRRKMAYAMQLSKTTCRQPNVSLLFSAYDSFVPCIEHT